MMQAGSLLAALSGCAALTVSAPAQAGPKHRPVALVKCDEPMGSAAIIEGEARSWVDKKLGSPKALITALAQQSGCFSGFDPATGEKADFLLSIVAGDQVEVATATSLNSDRMATAAAIAQNSGRGAGLGTVGDVAGMIPLAGAVMNGLAGMVGIGKKKTVVTGLTLSSTIDGQPIAAGTGLVQQTKLKFHDDDDDAMARLPEGYWMSGVETATDGLHYTKKEDGREMVHGFVMAFNNLVSQARAMGVGMIEEPPPVEEFADVEDEIVEVDPGPEPVIVRVAAASVLYLEPDRTAEEVRAIRPGNELTVIGGLEGIFLPVRDPYGVLGWVSVEDLE